MTSPGDDGSWRIWDPLKRIQRALENLDEVDQDALLGAIRKILRDPYEPTEIRVLPARGPAAGNGEQRLIAGLPGGWFLTYLPCPDGIPPLGGRHVYVMAMVRLLS